MDTPATSVFEAEIARYNRWRENLTRAVHDYHVWLEKYSPLDVQQSIRFYDLMETLGKGRLLLAFLAEFSRGKSELINALFFSSFKERLLPSDVGRTTMCPTEIFHDPNEEPYLKLLSVETRYRDESISQLKNMPVEWSRVRLNVDSAADMKKALSALADTKRVYALDARMMGLIPITDDGNGPKEDEIVEVPAWRYAMINYPHPLLTNGLAVLDTPGLNALGLEPELTLSTVPSAHAVLFLLGIDTGVTKSDLEIWERYVKAGLPEKIAVLNKVDLMWDELKTEKEIKAGMARMMDSTCKSLGLPSDKVFALSAQKALLGRIKDDAEMVASSGIMALEKYMSEKIIPMRRELLVKAVSNELGSMMASSHRSCVQKIQANQAQIAELKSLSGKSRDLATKIWQKANEEKESYNASLTEYKTQRISFVQKRGALTDALNPAKLDLMCESAMQEIDNSWFTHKLLNGMRKLMRLMDEEFSAASMTGEDAKALMQSVYNIFQQRFKFEKMEIPALDFEGPRNKMRILIFETENFCKDPVNVVMTEKRFMVRRFWRRLVDQARTIFSEAQSETERWITAVPQPLELQMKNHKLQLQQRLDALGKVSEKSGSINEEIAKATTQGKEIQAQLDMITNLISQLHEDMHDDEQPSFDDSAFLKTVVIKSPADYDLYAKTQKIDLHNL